MPTLNYDPNANKPIEAGLYRLRLARTQLREPKDPGGNPFLIWNFDIYDPENPTEILEGKTLGWISSTNMGPKSNAYKVLRALGMQELGEGTAQINTDNFVGCEIIANVVVKKGKNNNERNDFEGVYSITEWNARQAQGAKLTQALHTTPTAPAQPAPQQPAQPAPQQPAQPAPQTPAPQQPAGSAPAAPVTPTPPVEGAEVKTGGNFDEDFPE